jgi:integrase
MTDKSESGFTFGDAFKTAIETGDTSQLGVISKTVGERAARLQAALRARKAAKSATESDGRSERPARTSRETVRRKRGDGGVYLRGRIWWVTYSNNGEKVCESSGSEKEAEARKLLKKRMGEIVTGHFIGPDAEKVTVAELADDVVTDYKVNAQDSLDKAERSAKRIKGFFVNARAHAVKGDSIKKFIAQRQAEGAANATINRELAFLKRAYNLGIEAEKIVRKPYIPQLKEDNVRSGFFEYAEFVAVRDACPDYFKPVVTFAYYTGWRKEEILSLRWSQIDLQAEEIRLEVGTDKNDAGRVIAMDGELLETIKAQWERRKVVAIPGHSPTLLCQYVFHRNGRVIGGKRGDDPRRLAQRMYSRWHRSNDRGRAQGQKNKKVRGEILSRFPPDRNPRHDPSWYTRKSGNDDFGS